MRQHAEWVYFVVLNIRQEDTVKRFRMREINLLVSTAVLESAQVEIPKCGVVVFFDPPESFQFYLQGKVSSVNKILQSHDHTESGSLSIMD